MNDKIIRTVCLFTGTPTREAKSRLERLASKLSGNGFSIQTQRLCSPDLEGVFDLDRESDGNIFLSIGRLSLRNAFEVLERFYAAKNISFNVDLTQEEIDIEHANLLTDIIQKKAGKTFNFTYTFNNASSSPYFPSATYEKNGFSIGLQPTNLSAGCNTIAEWLKKMKEVWVEIDNIISSEEGYLGIDTSIAPLFEGNSSFINFLKRTGLDFDRSVTTEVYLQITEHIKNKFTKMTGLCGLMLPCLEDFDLAEEYEKGNFSIERNVFLSLHSGLGIDSYPIGVDEKPERIVEILRLVQGLSNKYKKPLSTRFVSDGVAKVGQKTNFKNQYLKDVIIRPL